MKTLWLAWGLALWTANASALAPFEGEPGDLLSSLNRVDAATYEAAGVLHDLAALTGSDLSRVYVRFYSGAVECFQSHPRQSRGYPGAFESCARTTAATYAASFFPSNARIVLRTEPEPLSRRDFSRVALFGSLGSFDHYSADDVRGRKLTRLDRILGRKTGRAIGLQEVMGDLASASERCALAPWSETQNQLGLRSRHSFQYCLYWSAYRNFEAIVILAGKPGAATEVDDLANLNQVPNRHFPVARFNDVGAYFGGWQPPTVKASGPVPGAPASALSPIAGFFANPGGNVIAGTINGQIQALMNPPARRVEAPPVVIPPQPSPAPAPAPAPAPLPHPVALPASHPVPVSLGGSHGVK